MDVIYFLLPLALLFAGGALALFIWAVRNGQFEDMKTPAIRILFDDEEKPGRSKTGDHTKTEDSETFVSDGNHSTDSKSS